MAGLVVKLLTAICNVPYTVYCCVYKLVYRAKDITQDVVLITGGGRGLGRAIALQLAGRKPRHIVIWGRNEAPLKQTANDIEALGVACTYMLCDVEDLITVYQRLADVKRNIGDITMLVNNAGLVHATTILDSTDEQMLQTYKVNTLAFISLLREVLPAMKARNQGHIVNINSITSVIPLPGAAFYSASKAANLGLVENLSSELNCENSDGVHFTSILPYQIDNSMFQGVSTRFPQIFPPIREDTVARATIDAILYNQVRLIMPLMFHFLYFCNTIFPRQVMLQLHIFTGVNKSMKGFHQ